MDEKSLSHTSWNCKYHIVLVPKYRRKVIYGKLRKDIGKILKYSLQGTTQGRYLTGGVPPVRFSM